MKNALSLFSTTLFSYITFAQQFSFSCGIDQKAYLGVDNFLTCTVENLSCNDILLTAENGTLDKNGCTYIYRPAKVGDTKIIISKKSDRSLKKIGEFYIRVKNFPSPLAFVGGIRNTEISKGMFRAQQGVGALAGCCFELSYTVKSFCMTIVRKEEVIFFQNCSVNMFDDKAKSFFASLQQEDIIIFSRIRVMTAR